MASFTHILAVLLMLFCISFGVSFLFYSVGTIVIASGSMLNVIIGFVVIVVGLYDFEFLLIYVVAIMSSLLFFILLLRRKEERSVMILLSLILLVKA